MPRNPEVLAFISRHRDSAGDEPTVSELLLTGQDAGRTAGALEAALRLAVDLAYTSGDVTDVLGWQDPPHESYAGAMARLQAEARARGWRWSKDGVDMAGAPHDAELTRRSADR